MPVLEQTSYAQEQNFDSSQYPTLSDPNRGVVGYNNQDPNFLQWLLNFREKSIIPLRNIWEGKIFDFRTQEWIPSPAGNKSVIMNDVGITWSISLIESYLNAVFMVTDLDLPTYNFTMREVARVIWNSLSLRYEEFGLRKSDIPRVAEEIESKIRALLSGARNDGFRRWFSTTNNYSENRIINTQSRDNKNPGVFSGLKSLFRKDEMME